MPNVEGHVRLVGARWRVKTLASCWSCWSGAANRDVQIKVLRFQKTQILTVRHVYQSQETTQHELCLTDG